MKAATSATVAALGITRNPELNQEDNAAFFPEKMEKARQIIARAGLPKQAISRPVKTKTK